MSPADKDNLVALSCQIAAAYVTRNSLAAASVPELLRTVHAALSGIGKTEKAETPTSRQAAAVSIRKSVTSDYLISLEDGKKYKILRPHLKGLGMTPEQYRTKWGLPADYPVVAPSYALRRSEMAKSFGLGQRSFPGNPNANKKK